MMKKVRRTTLDSANTDGFDRCENVAAVGMALTFPSKKLFAGVATRCVTGIISELRQQHLFTDAKEIFPPRRSFISCIWQRLNFLVLYPFYC